MFSKLGFAKAFKIISMLIYRKRQCWCVEKDTLKQLLIFNQKRTKHLMKNFSLIWLHQVWVVVTRDLSWHMESMVLVRRLSCSVACGVLVPWPGIEPAYAALQGGFLIPGPPGKSLTKCFHFTQIHHGMQLRRAPTGRARWFLLKLIHLPLQSRPSPLSFLCWWHQWSSTGAELTKGYSTAKQWELLPITTLSLTLNMATASPGVLRWDSMARACWTLLRIPARLVQLMQLGNALGMWLERIWGSLLKAGEANRLTFRLVWSCRASWAPTQFRARSSSWAHLRAREADNSFSPVMEANSAAVLSDATSPFLVKTLAAS